MDCDWPSCFHHSSFIPSSSFPTAVLNPPTHPPQSLLVFPSGMDLLLNAYHSILPKLGSGITSAEGINFQRLQMLLACMAKDEERAYERRAVRGR